MSDQTAINFTTFSGRQIPMLKMNQTKRKHTTFAERVLQRIKRMQRSVANFKSNTTRMHKQKEKFVHGMDYQKASDGATRLDNQILSLLGSIIKLYHSPRKSCVTGEQVCAYTQKILVSYRNSIHSNTM
jgi:hypothetical protein